MSHKNSPQLETVLEKMISGLCYPCVRSGHVSEWQYPGLAGFNGIEPKTLYLECDYHDHEDQGYPAFGMFFHGMTEPEHVLAKILATEGEILSVHREKGLNQPNAMELEFGEQNSVDKLSVHVEYCVSDFLIEAGPFVIYNAAG